MHLFTLFVSTAFVLAGMSAALPVERENMLVTRFADSDFLGDIEARGYDEEAELYSRGCILSKSCVRSGAVHADTRASSFSEFTLNTYPSSSHSLGPPGSVSSGPTLAPHPESRTGSRLSGSTATSSRRNGNRPQGRIPRCRGRWCF